MSPKIKPNAPRFHTLFEKRLGKPVFIIRRLDWEELKIKEGELVLLDTSDLSLLPIAPASSNPNYLCTVAKRLSKKVRISLYRLDSKDEPTPINVDNYTVWEELPSDLDVKEMVATGDTDYNSNLEHYLYNHVFLIKEDDAEGHWLDELPSEVAILLDQL